MSHVPDTAPLMNFNKLYRLRLLVRGARKAVRISVREHRDLEDWVSDDGRLVLIGEAAHPFPVSP